MFFTRIALLFKYFCTFALVLKYVLLEQDCTFKLQLYKVYRQPLANRYLASISKFIHANLDKAELEELVLSNFANFFEKNITRYSDASIHSLSAVGGIAAAYESQLRKCAKSYGYSVIKVLASPIDGLIEYHR